MNVKNTIFYLSKKLTYYRIWVTKKEKKKSNMTGETDAVGTAYLSAAL